MFFGVFSEVWRTRGRGAAKKKGLRLGRDLEKTKNPLNRVKEEEPKKKFGVKAGEGKKIAMKGER